MSRPLTIEDRLILACARTEPDLPGIRDLGERDPDWTLLLRKVERSRLATVVYVNLKKVAELPKVVAERLRPLHHREAVYAVARRGRLRTILVRLSEAGLPAVVPPATGDADLLVRDHDLHEVAALVQSIADPKRWSGRLAICSRITVFTAAGIPIEDVWERARPARIEMARAPEIGQSAHSAPPIRMEAAPDASIGLQSSRDERSSHAVAISAAPLSSK